MEAGLLFLAGGYQLVAIEAYRDGSGLGVARRRRLDDYADTYALLRTQDPHAYTEICGLRDRWRAHVATGRWYEAFAEFIDSYNGPARSLGGRPSAARHFSLSRNPGETFETFCSTSARSLEALTRVTAPLQVVEGSETSAVDHAICDVVRRHVPHVQHTLIEGAGHMMPLTHPEPLAYALLAGIERRASDRRSSCCRSVCNQVMTCRVSGLYGDDLAAVHASGFIDLARAAAEELMSRRPGPCLIVEFGCGDGTTARQLCDAGYQVHGSDVSEAMIRLAEQREPRATFEVGAFLDTPIPPCAAIIAIGEVFGYLAPGTGKPPPLGTVFARCRRALEPGGLLMFDLAGPGRIHAREQHGWTSGPGWVVLVNAHVEADTLIREIITFRDSGGSRYRRTEETHRLRLYRPSDVLAQLRRNGFTARTLRAGYDTIALPRGLTAYLAKRKRASARATRGDPGMAPT